VELSSAAAAAGEGEFWWLAAPAASATVSPARGMKHLGVVCAVDGGADVATEVVVGTLKDHVAQLTTACHLAKMRGLDLLRLAMPACESSLDLGVGPLVYKSLDTIENNYTSCK
jgi:hypothetical protein